MATRFKKIDTHIFALSLVIIVTVEVLLGWLVPRVNISPLYLFGAARFFEILFLAGLLVKVGSGLASVGLAPGTIIEGARRGFLWAAVFGLVAGMGYFLLFLLGLNPVNFIRTSLPGSTWERLLFFIVGGLMAPVAEELVFRGLVYGYLRRWGILAALIGSTLVFVVAHARHGIPVTQIIGGLVFAIAYEKERNLMVPMIIHVLGNSAIFSLSLVL